MFPRKTWFSAMLRAPRSFARITMGACLFCACAVFGSARSEEPKGLPFIRTYPFDEIGNVARGLRPGFDSFGRFAVMYDGFYSVLNDSTWVNRIDEASPNRLRMTTIRVTDGKYFYGGRGTWGRVELSPEGRFRADSLVPADAPAWTSVTAFNEILGTRTGIYFSELNGAVFWDLARQRNVFFELPRVSALIRVGERIFVSCQDAVLRELLPDSGSVRIVSGTGLDGTVVEYSVPLDTTHVLLALTDGRLVSFDGRTIMPWPSQTELGLAGRIAAITPLVEGGVALALPDKGLYLLSAEGAPRWVLSLPEFRRISALAANEPGVLWVVGENAVHKVFYDSPLTSFGRQLGLTVTWPKILSCNDRTVVCSNHVLYELAPAGPGVPARFVEISPAPVGGAFSAASNGSELLAGNATGVFARDRDGAFMSVARIDNVSALEFVAPDLCLVIGSREIAALRCTGGRWCECAPRIPGVGDAPIRSMVHGAVWLELGGARVARLIYRAGQLRFQPIPLPWNDTQWANIGAVGSTVIISGSAGHRVYYDEVQEKLVAAPALDLLLNRSPYWISHVVEDQAGTLWATHAQGAVTFTPEGGDYVVDATTFELKNDSYPTVTILPENNRWIASGRSLYHVEHPAGPPRPSAPAMLVSLVTDHSNLELQPQVGKAASAPSFAFDDNSLSVRLFSGTYAWRYPPLYQYRLGSAESWTPVDPGLLLRFPKLRDGAYRLEVRPLVPGKKEPPALKLDFEIKPPGYRTPLAYGVYFLILIVLIAGITRWTNQHSLKRNAVLERLVEERTRQLRITTEKLNEETRNAATTAERNRVAGELHDSLQQSLSGSIIQLDTTMNTAAISPEVRARLNIVRGMLSYTREEIQHSVWNMQSSLLQNSNLGDALRKLAGFISSGPIRMNVVVPEEPISLEPGVQHHLLRIAQEAITNAVKHAGATHLDVTMSSQAHSVLLTIEDDGSGFDPEACSRVGGRFGLRGIRKRARTIKAELLVRSVPGSGTLIQVSLPLSSLPPHESHDQSQPA